MPSFLSIHSVFPLFREKKHTEIMGMERPRAIPAMQSSNKMCVKAKVVKYYESLDITSNVLILNLIGVYIKRCTEKLLIL